MCEPKANPFYSAYALRNIQDYILKCGKFTTLPIINQDDTKALLFPTPPVMNRSAESRIFAALSDYRLRSDREFFKLPYREAISKIVEVIKLLQKSGYQK